jgi:prepilin-type N-terminal cleavage/methylation domain-containing protein
MNTPRNSSARRAGFTLIEVLVALTLFSVLGYSVALAVGVGEQSRGAVADVVDQAQELRAASTALMADLRATSADRIAIANGADGNHSVRLSVPIEVGGAIVWGVHERTLGSTAAAQDRPDWLVRYRVLDVATGGGAIDKQLVRELLDTGGVVRRTTVLVHQLRPGVAAPAGFQVVQVGAVWEVTLSTTGAREGQPGLRTVFHAQNRN